jgi:hypothetical protein
MTGPSSQSSRDRIPWILANNGGQMERSRLRACAGMRYAYLIPKEMAKEGRIRISGDMVTLISHVKHRQTNSRRISSSCTQICLSYFITRFGKNSNHFLKAHFCCQRRKNDVCRFDLLDVIFLVHLSVHQQMIEYA